MREPTCLMHAMNRMSDRVVGPKVAGVALALTVVLAVADLILTVHVAQTVGLLEANPVARALAEHSGAIGLGLFKALTVGLGVAVLLRVRRKRVARGAAVLVLAAHAWMMLQWVGYMDILRDAHDAGALIQVADARLAMRL